MFESRFAGADVLKENISFGMPPVPVIVTNNPPFM